MSEKVVQLTKSITEKFQSLSKESKRSIGLWSIWGVLISIVIVFSINNAIDVMNGNVEIPKDYEPIEIFIEEGDVAWDIQRKLTPNENIEKMLYYAEIENGKKMSTIEDGETLVFFRTKE